MAGKLKDGTTRLIFLSNLQCYLNHVHNRSHATFWVNDNCEATRMWSRIQLQTFPINTMCHEGHFHLPILRTHPVSKHNANQTCMINDWEKEWHPRKYFQKHNLDISFEHYSFQTGVMTLIKYKVKTKMSISFNDHWIKNKCRLKKYISGNHMWRLEAKIIKTQVSELLENKNIFWIYRMQLQYRSISSTLYRLMTAMWREI